MAYLGFVNLTPFASEQYALMDHNGVELFTYIVKATYVIDDGREPVPAENQHPILPAAQYYGDPESSSIKYDTETAFIKAGTDIVLIGHAHTKGPDRTQVDVVLKAGHLSKTVCVFGDRYWTKKYYNWRVSKPLPFDRIPLVYERAFGGWDRSDPDPRKHSFDERNGVGLGFKSPGANVRQGDRLPNLETPQHLIRKPGDAPWPAGFGFIAPNWKPRCTYAGTYDTTWKKKRMPLLPENFDYRFFNGAPAELISTSPFCGGEAIEIHNASSSGLVAFRLPLETPEAVMMMQNRQRRCVDLVLDTVIINLDDDLLFMIWRGSIAVRGDLNRIVWTKTQLKNVVISQMRHSALAVSEVLP